MGLTSFLESYYYTDDANPSSSLETISNFFFPNGWRVGSFRSVCVVSNPKYFNNPFASPIDKSLMIMVVLVLMWVNSMLYLTPSQVELQLMENLYQTCDTDRDNTIDSEELACFPFDQEFQNFGALTMDTDRNAFASRDEFQQFLINKALVPIVKNQAARKDFADVMQLLQAHATGKIGRLEANEKLNKISPYVQFYHIDNLSRPHSVKVGRL
mmetsp:Transcript_7003/g.12927  ORF Transcript_7003/g.12927 Transcript_7003/m.12927 type:complete len:213 (-) Transcript_7003:195-833(-)|eukprot:CAMPEP_0197528680 /NCGR_PEP_ID=MMETSP1318-20131121/25964_1 /TAXON_ID=552666 /ORGANISM="Partenskyella glossopodia, Strain RCC365" /LENGTH=212 /DNA_ID=CAMNT_0043083869 /DNA_START=96 /DNA_END=734 /DNA_ORIENTATION=+